MDLQIINHDQGASIKQPSSQPRARTTFTAIATTSTTIDMANQTTHQEARDETGDGVRGAVQEVDTTPSIIFPLMELPVELRFEVYRNLLVSSEDSVPVCMEARPLARTPDSEGEGSDKDSSSDFRTNGLHPNILQTSSQVFHEAAQVLYGENEFCMHRFDGDNPNASLVRRTRAFIGCGNCRFEWSQQVLVLTRFLRDHPRLTHLSLDFGDRAIERDLVQAAIQWALKKHKSLVDLEVSVPDPLSERSTDFCWCLYSIVRRNRASSRPEEVERDDTRACPPFVKVHNLPPGNTETPSKEKAVEW
ncbi:hypothetical protein V8E54_008297 [Elaphomyces granulatus]